MFGMMEALLSFIRRQVGLRTDPASATGSLHAKVANIWSRLNTNLDKKVSQAGIKSVQRGVLAAQNISKNAAVNVTISSVNMSKSFINLPGLLAYSEGSTNEYIFTLNVTLTSSTNLEFRSPTVWLSRLGSVAWEVIEFY